MAVRKDPGLVRVTVILDPEDKQGFGSESLWAESLGQSRYRLRNSPFFAYGISNDDIVLGKKEDGVLKVQGVLLRGDHSTYRLRLVNDSIDSALFLKHWEPLQKIGCTFEEGPVVAIDVPPDADIYAVYRLLEEGEKMGIWQFEEGHCGHRLEK